MGSRFPRTATTTTYQTKYRCTIYWILFDIYTEEITWIIIFQLKSCRFFLHNCASGRSTQFKTNSGFYTYDEKGKRGLLWDGLAAKYPVADDQPDLTEVQHRLLFAQTLEAVRALEEGVLEDIREGDVGAILGWGFAPWSGGPFSWLDIIGAGFAADRCDALTAQHGARFETPKLLREMAASGQTFYGRFGPKAEAA